MYKINENHRLFMSLGVVVTLSLLLVVTSFTRKEIMIYADGKVEQFVTTDLFARDVIGDFTYDAVDGIYYTNVRDFSILTPDTVIEIQTKKAVDVVVNNTTETVHTFANTVAELMNERYTIYNEIPEDLEVESLDKITEKYLVDEKYLDAFLTDLDTPLKLTHEKMVEQTRVVEVPHEVIYETTRDLLKGEERVIQEGIHELKKETTQFVYRNGELVDTIVLAQEVTQAGQATIIERGINSGVASQPAGVWDSLANCESGGRWDANTGNGYYGGLQWSAPTWNKAAAIVGLSHIPYAHLATRDEQILAAQAWLARTSWAQWPACSIKLGLR